MIDVNEEPDDEAATRDGFGHGLVEAADTDDTITVLSADLTHSTRTHWFKDKYPDRFVETGISEQNMMSAAAGMAQAGKTPFACSFAAFSPGRNYDQLRVSVCYSDHPVTVFGSHAGVSVGGDGATHQMMEDIAMTRALPNMTVIVPCDAEEARKATRAAAALDRPVYIRASRMDVPTITKESTPFTIGESNTLRHGDDITIIATGIVVQEAYKAAKELQGHGVSARVINMHTVKPLDTDAVIQAARDTSAIITVEEHQVHGGLGGAVTEAVTKHHPVRVERIAVDDEFGESGDGRRLLEEYGLTSPTITERALAVTKEQEVSL